MKREKISLELLLLSDGNPRLEPSFGEDEAINNMVADQDNKLVELASDIVVPVRYSWCIPIRILPWFLRNRRR